MKELWAQLEFFPIYSVSTEGRVRNDARASLVHISINNYGWPKVNLHRDGCRYTRTVKGLVAEAFLPKPREKFTSVICLDGNQTNVGVSNLAWRPQWFAWQYTAQFKTIPLYDKFPPIVDRRTDIVYDGVIHASLENGLLFFEVAASLVNKTPVFPDWKMFDFYKEVY